MKVLLYFEGQRLLNKSGIGRALEHQKRALSEVGIDYTLDPKCTDYDILHINTYGLHSVYMVKKARKLGKKVIYHAHSTEEDFRNSFIGSNQIAPLVKKYLVSLYERADYIVTPTEYSKKLLEGYGLKNPISAVSNGINLERFAPNAKKEEEFREYFHVQPNEKIIICVGLYFARKGLIDFVEIAKQMPEYRFIWFGYTPFYAIPHKNWEIVKHKHPKNLEFAGYIKGDVIEGAYSAADLFFFPSYEETEGIVVLEALASKQCVLVRDIPVYDGWLVDEKNCLKATNNPDFIKKIRQLTTEDTSVLRENGWKTAEERSISNVAQQLKAIYEKVLAGD
jgi:1,2-diacylglycerol-3-alpha-glucose alpha-1,2-glucosyltransferase